MARNLDEAIAALTRLRDESPWKGETVLSVCFQGMEYVPLASAKLAVDPDGAIALLIPEEPNAVQSALDRLADPCEEPASSLGRSVLRQAWELYDRLRRKAGISAPNEILWWSCSLDRVYEAVADGKGGALAIVRDEGNPTDVLCRWRRICKTEDEAVEAIRDKAIHDGVYEPEDEDDVENIKADPQYEND